MLSHRSMGMMIQEELITKAEDERINGKTTGRKVYICKTVNPASDHSAVVGRGDTELEARSDWFRRAEDRWQF